MYDIMEIYIYIYVIEEVMPLANINMHLKTFLRMN